MALIWAVNFSVIKFADSGFVAARIHWTSRWPSRQRCCSRIAARQGRKWPPRRDVLLLILLGMIGNGLYQILFVEGSVADESRERRADRRFGAGFIAVVSRMKGIERVRRRTLWGVALSVSGVALVVYGSARTDHTDATLLGTLLVFCGVLCWTLFTVNSAAARHSNQCDPTLRTDNDGWLIPLLVASPKALAATDWSVIGPAAWASLFYASVVSMVIAYLFWYRGMRVLGPTRTAVYSNLQPVIAIAVAWMFLHESPTVWQGVGRARS